jgi:orotidine-5'-phosphate decarboxylase
VDRGTAAILVTPVPIIALDYPTAELALDFVDRLPDADFYKVGSQLFIASGPGIVRELRARGLRVFLDLKLHDIPNTVAGAVRAAGALGVELLTIHAAGGAKMIAAAAAAAAEAESPPRVFAVTVLTSLTGADLRPARGGAHADPAEEAVRLAMLAAESGAHGVVTSVHEVAAIRAATRPDLPVLTPGIRLAGDDVGDQARVASPAEAASLGVDYLVVGRSLTAAPDPRLAWRRITDELGGTSHPESLS